MGKKPKKTPVKPVAVKKPKTAPAPPATLPVQEYDARESLMPELDALVKKNPNRLIGCGG